MSEYRENSSGFFSGLVLGSVAGAAAFFLFGTKKGRKIKKILLEEGKELLEELEEVKGRLEDAPKTEEIQVKALPRAKKTPQKKRLVQRFFQRNGKRIK